MSFFKSHKILKYSPPTAEDVEAAYKIKAEKNIPFSQIARRLGYYPGSNFYKRISSHPDHEKYTSKKCSINRILVRQNVDKVLFFLKEGWSIKYAISKAGLKSTDLAVQECLKNEEIRKIQHERKTKQRTVYK